MQVTWEVGGTLGFVPITISRGSVSDTQLWPSHFHPMVLREVLLSHPSAPDFWRAVSPLPQHPATQMEGQAPQLAAVPITGGVNPKALTFSTHPA